MSKKERNRNIRKKATKITLPILLVMGVISQIFAWNEFKLASADISLKIGWLMGLIALMSGLVNVYFTTNKSSKFFIPDLIWIFASIASLSLKHVWGDIPTYIFYLFVAYPQYRNWKQNEDDTSETVMLNMKKKKFIAGLAFAVMLGIVTYFALDYAMQNISGFASETIVANQKLDATTNKQLTAMGAMAFGFSVTGAIVLKDRYFESAYYFMVANILQIILLTRADLGLIALIPLAFAIDGVIVMLFNNPRKQND